MIIYFIINTCKFLVNKYLACNFHLSLQCEIQDNCEFIKDLRATCITHTHTYTQTQSDIKLSNNNTCS